MAGAGAAAVTGEGQAATVWHEQVAGIICSEALAELGLPKDYCCLQVALLTRLIVVICTSHAECSCTQVFSFSVFITKRCVSLESFLSQNAPTGAARALRAKFSSAQRSYY